MNDDLDRDHTLGVALRELPVPEHGPEFFSELLTLLEEERPKVPSPHVRRHWYRRPLAAVAAAAAIAAIAVGVMVFPRPQSALAIMKDAQEAFADVPPFRAELSRLVSGESNVFDEFPEHTGEDWVYRHQFWYGGSQGWRREILEDTLPFMRGGEGSFMVFDGEQTGVYFAHATGPEGGNAHSFYITPGEDAQFSPLLELSPEPTGGIGKLIQTRAGPGMRFDDYFEELCRVLPDDHVAGRVARHLSCEAGYQELWLDAETGLILRHVTPESRQEIESIEYNPTFAPGVFEFVPPPGAVEAGNEEPAPAVLEVGEPVPPWTGTLLGGGELSLHELRGKPVAVYVWASWCPPCVGDPLESFEGIRRDLRDKIHFVTVAVGDRPESIEAFVAEAGYGFPVVLDEGSEIARKWGIRGIPVLVLIDPDGRLLASYDGPLSGENLRRVLDALASGRPIPKVSPQT